jgi:hypothetical protein
MMGKWARNGTLLRRGPAIGLALTAVVLLSGCQVALIPVPNPTPAPCHADCPPPARHETGSHTIEAQAFSVLYFDPWTIDSNDNSQVTLTASTQYGNVYAVVASQSVPDGTTAQQLLSSTIQSDLDPSQYAGVQDGGPILGAEIGYVSGAGERYAATVSQQNAPDVPVYLEFMAAVRGTTGLIFESFTPLDPNSPSANMVPNDDYDQMVNGVAWK